MWNAWQRARAYQEKLVAEHANMPAYRQELAQSYCNLGFLLQALHPPMEKKEDYAKRLQAARDEYQKAMTLQRKLKDEYPHSLDYKSELGATLDNLAFLLTLDGKTTGVERLWSEALSLQLAALDSSKGNPLSPAYRDRYRNHYMLLADSQARRGNYAEALKTIDELLKNHPDSWQVYPHTVGFLAGCVPHLAKDAKLSEAYGSRAVALLREMVAKKLQTLEQLKDNPAFDPLRSRADFKKLLAELEATSG
jgi:tetratricopeptide (TPR) repeat protein